MYSWYQWRQKPIKKRALNTVWGNLLCLVPQMTNSSTDGPTFESRITLGRFQTEPQYYSRNDKPQFPGNSAVHMVTLQGVIFIIVFIIIFFISIYSCYTRLLQQLILIQTHICIFVQLLCELYIFICINRQH